MLPQMKPNIDNDNTNVFININKYETFDSSISNNALNSLTELWSTHLWCTLFDVQKHYKHNQSDEHKVNISLGVTQMSEMNSCEVMKYVSIHKIFNVKLKQFDIKSNQTLKWRYLIVFYNWNFNLI